MLFHTHILTRVDSINKLVKQELRMRIIHPSPLLKPPQYYRCKSCGVINTTGTGTINYGCQTCVTDRCDEPVILQKLFIRKPEPAALLIVRVVVANEIKE